MEEEHPLRLDADIRRLFNCRSLPSCVLHAGSRRAQTALLMRAGLSPCTNLQGPSGFRRRSAEHQQQTVYSVYE